MVPLCHGGAMAGHEEENPWSKESIRRELERLEQDRTRAAATCERIAHMEAVLAGAAPVLRHEEEREEALKAAVKIHEMYKLSVALLERLGWILEAEQQRLDSESPKPKNEA